MKSLVIKEYINLCNISTSSKSGYFYDLNSFFNYIKEKNDYLKDISNFESELKLFKICNINDIYSYIDYLKKDCFNSTKTIARKISSIKNLYKYLNKNYDLNSDIVSFSYKYNYEKDIDILNDIQIKELIKHTNTLEDSRNKIIIFLMLFHGLTVKEVRNLKVCDILNNSIIVNSELENKRIIQISEPVRAILSDFIKLNDITYLLNGRNKERLSTRTIQYVIKNALANIGIDTKGVSSGILRNTCVYMLKEYSNAGFKEVKDYLGLKTDKQVEKYFSQDDNIITSDDINKNPYLKKLK